MNPVRRCASSTSAGGRSLWPGDAGSAGALDGVTRAATRALDRDA
jgi:hypothetical protein